uniref:Hemoglobin subunit alpha-2 n=1 Tax=Varanus albigularis TaxID=8558 RepID=HBA2_VARAL|nr:RecName: Full=Hemoglobin subunit alpha-2; AltName: Full=Alpha-2-globin; AltName: Full=Hemoglobin alpha-2 chain; AltName: Full=Hemoglobin alpha-II chain [Varanus albigularis]AAB20248.1 hemoglobin alpha chain [Varanus exanthematicus=monitor lizards, ssp. albigularis, Peptide, 141 aa] [Varanus exanthematicus]
VLTEDDKNHVKGLWAHVHDHIDEIAADALTRMFLAHPASKTYFAHFDLSPDNAQIKAHGKKVANALNQAVAHLDDIKGTLSKLSELHAQQLRVDPVNFGFLRHCLEVSIAAHLHDHLKASVIVSLDKFLEEVCKDLVSKYR